MTIDDHVLTKRKCFQTHINHLYNSEGEILNHDPTEYPGQWLDSNLESLSDAILRYQRGKFDRYEELPAKMEAEPGFSTIVLSFCDGEHVRIAYQPISGDIGYKIPIESTIGYAVDPDEICQELIKCYRKCVDYVERAYTDWDYGDLSEEIEYIQNWGDEHIHELLAATSEEE